MDLMPILAKYEDMLHCLFRGSLRFALVFVKTRRGHFARVTQSIGHIIQATLPILLSPCQILASIQLPPPRLKSVTLLDRLLIFFKTTMLRISRSYSLTHTVCVLVWSLVMLVCLCVTMKCVGGR